MARLHVYAKSADKTGYYLKGWTPQTGHTTVQVRRICGKLFEWLGFSVGDQLPHDLLHGLLDVGLLYTGDPTEPANNLPDNFNFQRDIKNVLTQEQYNRLIGFAQSYGNDAPTSIQQLITRLNAQTIVVDDKYIPDTASSSNHGHTNSREIDHGRFERIIQEVYRNGLDTRPPDCLTNLELPENTDHDSVIDAAAEYHQHQPVTAAQVTDMQLEYASRLTGLEDTDYVAGPLCGFRVSLGDDYTVVLEVIAHPNTLDTVLDYGESGIRHRLVLSTAQSVDWETVVPTQSNRSSATDRSKLLEHQITVLRMMAATIQLHPGITADGVIELVVGGGYLEQGLRTTPDIWKNSSLLGELLAPDPVDERLTGTVNFFNDTGGYGFIDTPGHDEDVFYHMEEVGGRDIKEHQEVKFSVVETEKGPRAADVKRL